VTEPEPTVFVVDDDPSVRRSTERLGSLHGIRGADVRVRPTGRTGENVGLRAFCHPTPRTAANFGFCEAAPRVKYAVPVLVSSVLAWAFEGPSVSSIILLFALSSWHRVGRRRMGGCGGGGRHLSGGSPQRPRRICALIAPVTLRLVRVTCESSSWPAHAAADTVTRLRPTRAGSNVVPSRQSAKRIPASRRARATTAMPLPRRAASAAPRSVTAATPRGGRARCPTPLAPAASAGGYTLQKRRYAAPRWDHRK
jgi:hypothetical protein